MSDTQINNLSKLLWIVRFMADLGLRFTVYSSDGRFCLSLHAADRDAIRGALVRYELENNQ